MSVYFSSGSTRAGIIFQVRLQYTSKLNSYAFLWLTLGLIFARSLALEMQMTRLVVYLSKFRHTRQDEFVKLCPLQLQVRIEKILFAFVKLSTIKILLVKGIFAVMK